ncbi:phospholipase D family protein [Bdellovibrionota bacterium FG-1]
MAAVAYIGRSASKALPKHKVTLLCNFDSMGTNPEEILTLKKKHFRVRKIKNLHAKVYCSSRGAIVGSANLSTNGLELYEGVPAALIEAAVFISPDEPAYRKIRQWCKTKEKQSQSISSAELKKKIAWWRAIVHSGHGSGPRKDTPANGAIGSHRKQAVELSDILKHPDDYVFCLYTEFSDIQPKKERLVVEGQPVVMKEFQRRQGSDDFMEDTALYDKAFEKKLGKFADTLHARNPVFIIIRASENGDGVKVRSNSRVYLAKFKTYHPHKKRKAVLMFFDTREPYKTRFLSSRGKKDLLKAFSTVQQTKQWDHWSNGKMQKEWWGASYYLTGRGLKTLLSAAAAG